MVTLETAKQSGLTQNELDVKALAVASLLSAERHHMEEKVDADGLYDNGFFDFDPRFLVFEIAHNLVLRQSQCLLVRKFHQMIMGSAAGTDSPTSIVHQMIMGSGKTTVVAPLLALLLGDGMNLVVEVVPKALLEFTRRYTTDHMNASLLARAQIHECVLSTRTCLDLRIETQT